MLRQAKGNCGQAAAKATADAGYWKPDVQEEAGELGTDVYVATERKKRKIDSAGDKQGRNEKALDARARMREKLRSDEGKQIYSRRKAVVEPVFGQAKEARGLRRFLLRGLEAVGKEWSLICTAGNLLKLHKAIKAAAT